MLNLHRIRHFIPREILLLLLPPRCNLAMQGERGGRRGEDYPLPSSRSFARFGTCGREFDGGSVCRSPSRAISLNVTLAQTARRGEGEECRGIYLKSLLTVR